MTLTGRRMLWTATVHVIVDEGLILNPSFGQYRRLESLPYPSMNSPRAIWHLYKTPRYTSKEVWATKGQSFRLPF